MLYNVGYLVLITAMLLTVFGVGVGLWGGQTRNAKLAASSFNVVYATAVLVGLAAIILWYALLTDQFQLTYVWNGHCRLFTSFPHFGAGKRGVCSFGR